LGSLVNGNLTVGLVDRLKKIPEVPKGFYNTIIEYVETGKLPAGSGSASVGGSAEVDKIVNKVVGAAYGAFHTGLDVSLIVSGLVIIGSGIIAWFTLAPKHSKGETDAWV
jgi:hypothetical protein